MADMALMTSTMTDKGLVVTVTKPPTFPAGNVPQVIPGKSSGQEIEGDFPLDQLVIDRK